MLTKYDLYTLAKSRFDESKILRDNSKPDGAVYLCGYAMELMLKFRIIHILQWDGYPDTPKEFADKKTFRTHDLELLLELSGLKKVVFADIVMLAKWQIVSPWNSEIRYKAPGTFSNADADSIINATRDILNYIVSHST